MSPQVQLLAILSACIRELVPGTAAWPPHAAIDQWNNHPDRTHADVLALLDLACSKSWAPDPLLNGATVEIWARTSSDGYAMSPTLVIRRAVIVADIDGLDVDELIAAAADEGAILELTRDMSTGELDDRGLDVYKPVTLGRYRVVRVPD